MKYDVNDLTAEELKVLTKAMEAWAEAHPQDADTVKTILEERVAT